MEQFSQALINGVMLGGVYAVMVLGFSIFWGATGVINLAHGEFLMVGAYLTWIINRQFGWEPFAALIVVMPAMFALGYTVQRILINRIIERPQLISLLVTYALSIIIANLFKLLFTATPRSVNTVLSGFWRYGNVTIPMVKTYDLIAALIMMVISSVYAMTFALCIALTGAAGVLVSPTQPIWPFMGPQFSLKAFAITTMSGLSSVPGALLGSLLLGLIEVYVATYVPGVGTNLGIVSSYIVLVVVLATRPQGLFGGLKAMDV